MTDLAAYRRRLNERRDKIAAAAPDKVREMNGAPVAPDKASETKGAPDPKPGPRRDGLAITGPEEAHLKRAVRSALSPEQLARHLEHLAETWERTPADVRRMVEAIVGPAAVPTAHLTPVERALALLGGRAAECGSGFRLDGRPASAAMVVTAANTVLRALGRPAIAYPGVRP